MAALMTASAVFHLEFTIYRYNTICNMESHPVSTRRRFQDQVFVWDRRFETRQRHEHEGYKLTPENQESIITTFIKQLGLYHDTPQYHFSALREFLN